MNGIKLFFILLTLFLCGCECAVARDLSVNNIKIAYSELLNPHCELFLRHSVGPLPAGYGSGYDWCKKYVASKDADVINYLDVSAGSSAIPVLKKDYISLDEFPAWNGEPPIRARFSIGAKHDDPDPDVAPSYLPYAPENQVFDYMLIDREGYEVRLSDGARSGYRFYEFSGKCYLATIKKPRIYKYVTNCQLKMGYDGFPKSIDVSSHQWINVTNQNTVDLNERMPADSVEIPGNMPVKPLIYSDFPIGDDGRVSKGRAMCMADCAPGMLMKLLHTGQSIWGPSGKPSAATLSGAAP